MIKPQYTDIGHRDKWDQLWLLVDGTLETSKRVTSEDQAEPWTHWLLWGGETKHLWHGRYDVVSSLCSIVRPVGNPSMEELVECVNLLGDRFLVDKFVLFSSEEKGKPHVEATQAEK